MKSTLTIAFLFIATLFSGRSLAQSDTTKTHSDSLFHKIDFAVKLGTNIQSMSAKAWESNFTPGIVGGLMVGMHKNKLGVSLEVLVSNASLKSTVLTVDSAGSDKITAKILYIHIPLLLEYQFIPALKLQAGPQYSNMISANGNSFEAGDPKALFKISEFSAVVGLEARFLKNVLGGARYIAGLTDVNSIPLPLTTNDQWKNTTIQLYLGYRFN